MPSIERLRFTSSGTEAVDERAAPGAGGDRPRPRRQVRGRLSRPRGRAARRGRLRASRRRRSRAAPGVPDGGRGDDDRAARTTTAAAVTPAFAAHAGRIAAVIVEPVAANVGRHRRRRPGFLEHLRELTRADGALLIFDEVITGFRVGRGGAQARFGVQPDLTTLGKIIGGGMPIGAYGGRARPDGARRAGRAGLPGRARCPAIRCRWPPGSRRWRARRRALRRARGRRPRAGDGPASRGRRGPGDVSRRPRRLAADASSSGRRAPLDAADALAADRAAFARFFGSMLDAGVLLPPSPFEAWFLVAGPRPRRDRGDARGRARRRSRRWPPR